MGKQMMRLLTYALASISILWGMQSCSPTYVIQAGWQEAVILAKREDIKDVINAPETPTALKSKLLLVQSAQAFSPQMGLNSAKSYTTYSDLDRKELVWVISAAPQFSLETYTWWFPIVGSFPYKGFFDKEDAIKEADKLALRNYDTYVRHSPAFSTLGWFDDPLLSTIANYERLTLLEIVFHEMVHSTIWFPDKASFNETLANVISLHALESFLDSGTEAIINAGIRADEIETMRQEVAKRRIVNLLFATWLQRLKVELENFYLTDTANNSALKTKNDIYAKHLSQWKDISSAINTRNMPKAPSNNAMLVANLTYYDRPAKLECLYLRSQGIADFLKKLRTLQELAHGKDTSIEETISSEIQREIPLCSKLKRSDYYNLIASDCPCVSSMQELAM